MKPFHKLLVPVDFSMHSKEVLQVAADLGRRYEASITVVHVCEHQLFSVPESFRLYDPTQLPRMMDHLRQLLENTRHDLRAAAAMSVDTALLQGTPFAEIVRFAQEGNYDLIVMGTHGRTGLAHALLGSVAERVMRVAPCAVLTVRAPVQQDAKPASGERAQA
jgi:nucleotide-binding universal stress UspA family protein